MTTQIKSNFNLKGVYTITRAFLEKPEHFALNSQIEKLKSEGKEFMHLARELNAMCRTDKFVVENIVPTVARTMIANNLTNASPTHVMRIKHCALGTSSTAVANGDTQLGTETYRNAIASLTNSNNLAYATGFFTATEVSGTFAECGIFADSTLTANSGVLISHVLISITKTTSQTLTLDWTLTIS